MSKPKDQKLYDKVKKEIYKKYPEHSAYRSGILVKTYKEKYEKKYGNKNAYEGKKDMTKGLGRWYAEKWKNQRGGTGYKTKSDVYRPTKRITKDTPTTFKELSNEEIKKARSKKYRKGRVDKFKE